MAYDECILKGPRGRCATWPILDPAKQVHPGLHLGGGGNGVCISHAKSLLRDVKRGDIEVYDHDGNPTDLEGKRLDTGETDPDWRREIERVHEVWEKASGQSYLKKRKESAMSEQVPEKKPEQEQPTGEAAQAVRFGIVDSSDPKKAFEQLLTLDSDNDGVPNYRDKAPFDPKTSSLVCSGCGERYDPGQIEGKMHDHWTAAADDHTASVPGDSNVRHLFGLDKDAATFRRTKTDSDPHASKWDKDVMHSVTKQGGFTFRDVVGDGPGDGFMVSVAKHNEVKVPMRDLTPDKVADYMSVHQQELKDPNNYLGGWVYKGNVYLDISRHTRDRGEAMKLARANQQLGVYDIGKGETLMTEPEPQREVPKAAMVTSSTLRDPADREGIDRFIEGLKKHR